MKRTTIYFLVFLITGIISGTLFPDNMTINIAVFLLSLALSLHFNKKYDLKRIFLFPIFTALGIFTVSLSYSQPFQIENSYENLTLYGEITNTKQISPDTEKCIIKTEKIIYNNTVLPYSVNISLYNNSDNIIHTGDIIKTDCRIRSLNKDNSEFFYERSNGIMFTGTITTAAVIGNVKSVYFYRDYLRNNVFNVLDMYIPQTESSIYKAMLTGDNEFLSEDTKDTFRKAGIYHILAISGLHIGILALIFTLIFNFKNKIFTAAATISALFLYTLFTGANIPTIRGFIMFSLFIAAPLLKRSADFITSACIPCIILLISSPLLLFNVGFIYSFGIIFTIGFIAMPLYKHSKNNLLNTTLLPTAIICCISKFISAYFFYYISIYDIFSNVIISFFMTLVFALGLFTVFTGFLFPFITPLIAYAATSALTIVEATAHFFANLPYSYINTGKPSELFSVTFIILLIFIIYIIYNKHNFINYKRYLYTAIITFTVINIMPTFFIDKSLNIDILYVKEGDCISISQNNIHFAIDGGSNTYIYTNDTVKSSENNTLLNFYEKKGITDLDYVFVTHTDSDHIDGIMNLIGKRKIKKAVLSATAHDSNKYKQFIEKCNKYNIDIMYMKKGDTINFGNDFTLECIYPDKDINTDGNSSSLVLMLSYKNKKFLFTGDIDTKIESSLLSDNIKADFLKVAHHGSKYSSSKDFIKAVNPDFAVISAGINNKYGFPDPDTVLRFNSLNIPVYSTAENGNIHITSDGNKIYIS